MDRKEELKQQYKHTKSDMGTFIICSKVKKKCYIQSTKDLRGVINGTRFKLSTGSHPNRELQKDWKEIGEDNFTIEIVEKLEYSEDEAKIDYDEELTLLKMIWEEKKEKDNFEFYIK